MPGRLFLHRPVAEVASALTVPTGALPDQEPRHNIAPGQHILTGDSEGLTLRRWGIIPVGRVNARGRPVMETIINVRSETVFSKSAFEATARAVVPADGWYEWTGEARRKTPWRITRKDGGLLWFAAITDLWVGPGGIEVPQVATLTCAPNADVSGVHHRMGVLLAASDIAAWLNGSPEEVAPLLAPLQDGLLKVEEAVGVDWGAP